MEVLSKDCIDSFKNYPNLSVKDISDNLTNREIVEIIQGLSLKLKNKIDGSEE